MGIFDRLFRRASSTDEPPTAVYMIPPRGKFDVNVVGESYYLEAFRRICGRADGRSVNVTASLVREPRNRYDSNAVAVVVSGDKIGHLGREDALRYRALIERLNAGGASVACQAQIKAGWVGSEAYACPYSTRLDLPPPPEEAFEKWSEKLRTLKSPSARRGALEQGLGEIIDPSLREKLRVQAARLEVEHVLAKVASLKSEGSKRKQLEGAARVLESLELPGEIAAECLGRVHAALAQLTR